MIANIPLLLQERLDGLSAGQRDELRVILTALADKGIIDELDEPGLHELLDAITAPIPPAPPDFDDLLTVMSRDERRACLRLGKRISARDMVRIAPWLADWPEVMRRVEEVRSLPRGGEYAALLQMEEERFLYAA